MKKLLIVLLTCALMLCQLTVFVSAADTETVNAQIDNVYGGANGIVSMTFDDGYYETAVLLNELFAKYNLKGSLMIIGDKTNRGETGYLSASAANAIFDDGRLEPQSHSMNHIRLSDLPSSAASTTYYTEIAQAKTLIESMFPEYDILSFAIPHGTMDNAATDYAKQYYYAMRTNAAGVQTLDPGFNNSLGNWAAMYAPATYRLRNMYGSFTDDEQWEMVKSDIDKAANGWYIPLTHRVGDVDGTDMSYAVANKMFAYIASLRDEGKVWVATYSEAIKYVRERQNTTLSAKKVGGNISLTATLADKTQDGLSLDESVFNQPLTVKVEVDANCSKVYYLDGCVQKSVDTFSEGSKRYARVEIVPNGEELTLYTEEQNTETLPHDYRDPTCSAPATCKVCGFTTGTTLTHDFADATCEEPKTCTLCQATEGEALGHDYTDATCTTPKTCTVCGKTSGNTAIHNYIPATCTEPKTCRDCGVTTGNPLGHNNDNSTCLDTECTRCNQIVSSTKSHSFTAATCTEPKTCTSCGTTEGEARGHAVNTANTCAKILCLTCKTLVQGDKEHTFADATCTKAKTCTSCGATEGQPLGHTPEIESTGATDSHKSTCSVCLAVINETEPHKDADSDGLCDGCNAEMPKDEAPEENNPTVIIVIIVGGVAIAAGAAAFVIIRKKKAK